jgi:2-oxoglutarate ferredoxin oxidoreductase subunit gamma
LLHVCPVITSAGLEKALRKTLPERHHNLIPLNMEALRTGGEIMEKK